MSLHICSQVTHQEGWVSGLGSGCDKSSTLLPTWGRAPPQLPRHTEFLTLLAEMEKSTWLWHGEVAPSAQGMLWPTEYIQPVCLPAAGQALVDGKLCTVTGWGNTQYYGEVAIREIPWEGGQMAGTPSPRAVAGGAAGLCLLRSSGQILPTYPQVNRLEYSRRPASPSLAMMCATAPTSMGTRSNPRCSAPATPRVALMPARCAPGGPVTPWLGGQGQGGAGVAGWGRAAASVSAPSQASLSPVRATVAAPLCAKTTSLGRHAGACVAS